MGARRTKRRRGTVLDFCSDFSVCLFVVLVCVCAGYAQHTLKSCFNVQALDVLAVSKSFGFDAPPKVHLKISLKTLKQSEKRAGKQADAAASKNGFSEDNPYGNRAKAAQHSEEDAANDQRAHQAQQAVTKKPQQSRQWSR